MPSLSDRALARMRLACLFASLAVACGVGHGPGFHTNAKPWPARPNSKGTGHMRLAGQHEIADGLQFDEDSNICPMTIMTQARPRRGALLTTVAPCIPHVTAMAAHPRRSAWRRCTACLQCGMGGFRSRCWSTTTHQRSSTESNSWSTRAAHRRCRTASRCRWWRYIPSARYMSPLDAARRTILLHTTIAPPPASPRLSPSTVMRAGARWHPVALRLMRATFPMSTQHPTSTRHLSVALRIVPTELLSIVSPTICCAISPYRAVRPITSWPSTLISCPSPRPRPRAAFARTSSTS